MSHLLNARSLPRILLQCTLLFRSQAEDSRLCRRNPIASASRLFADFLGMKITHLDEGYLVLLDVVHELDYLGVICPVLRVQWDPNALGQI